MDYERCKARMNVEGDRLSMLPDDLIHKILSFISIENAIETSVLSSRWRFIWTTMPYLNFCNEFFALLPNFSNFISCRNNEIEVYSVKLSFHQMFREVFLKTILDCAFSHNVQQLTVSCSRDENVNFPLNLFRSQSLKYLRLTGVTECLAEYPFTLTSTWELPALTTLHLDYVTLYNDNTDKGISLFSKCVNLKNLTLKHFTLINSNVFSICHPRLSNLTLENGYWGFSVVKVVADQLKNLRIISCFGEHIISAPELVSLVFKHCESLQFSTDDLCSLEKVDLCIYPEKKDARKLVRLLQRLHSVKFLTLNLELVEFLSSFTKLHSLQPSPFVNLKSLKIYPNSVSLDENEQKKVNMSTEVLNYLLNGSPSAIFTMVSHEEIQAYRNAVSAQILMESLRVMLDREKADSATNRAHKDVGNAPMESHEAKMHEHGKPQPVEKMKLQIGEKMVQVQSCWEDLGVQIDQGRKKTSHIIFKLRDIEVLVLNELPASRRDKLHACYSSLCADVDILVKKTIDSMMIQ